MASIDKGIDFVAAAFTQAANEEEAKMEIFLEEEFNKDPNLRFRIATFLRQPALKAILQGNYGAQPGASPPATKPVKESPLHPNVKKFFHLLRHFNPDSIPFLFPD